MKQRPLSDLGKALERIRKQERQIGSLTTRCDVAERQARSLTLELQAARRTIAQLQSLNPNRSSDETMIKIGKGKSGRLLDGVKHNGMQGGQN